MPSLLETVFPLKVNLANVYNVLLVVFDPAELKIGVLTWKAIDRLSRRCFNQAVLFFFLVWVYFVVLPLLVKKFSEKLTVL